MIVKIIGAKEDAQVATLLKGLPNVIVEFFDDLITFKNSFPEQIPITELKNCFIFLLVKELPVASFHQMTSGNTSTTQIMLSMKNHGIPLFNMTYHQMGLEEKVETIKKIVKQDWSTPTTTEWPGWPI